MSKCKTTAEIRQAFLDFFAQKNHEIVASSPLVPVNDPTLLFTNAGMVQFKDVFLGRESRAITRAASSQACIRAGGKHNDLDNVGYTSRHHTFFEMLGNFSFGDYFKEEAIQLAWELLINVYHLPQEKLWVTVYDQDEEAYQIWHDIIKVPRERIVRIGDNKGAPYASDNFWQMGDTGPCGPCTEIFYDHGPEIAGGPPGSPDADGDRYIEIWNLVFMQYNRDGAGELHPLPKTSVDTGMGLERIAAVLQGVHSNYEIDLFKDLINTVAVMATPKADQHSLQVIADHIRSCAFIVAEGVVPSNEGRGYVLRRIIRRAVRHGHKVGISEVFFYRLVAPLVRLMGASYPLLTENQAHLEQVLLAEEESFILTLDKGLKLFERAIAELQGNTIPGAQIFQLYDTYGFPVDLTADIARERGLTLDIEGFNREMEIQRERARAAGQFIMAGNCELTETLSQLQIAASTFQGYETVTTQAEVLAMIHNGKLVANAKAGEEVVVLLDNTPFYAESGGQVGDKGEIKANNGLFQVVDTRKQGPVFLHFGTVQRGEIKLGDSVEAQVYYDARQAIACNHSATHLLHAALRQILGKHVTQKGSLVTAERLRFDFSNNSPLTLDELRQLERLVNQQIRNNHIVQTTIMPMQQAMQSGAMALFGEKYENDVRVLNMGNFSIELCGGTHVTRTGEIGLFKILNETGIAAGVRRIEACTANNAYLWVAQIDDQLQQIAELLRASRDGLPDKVRGLLERNRQLEKEITALQNKLNSQSGNELSDRAVLVAGIKVVTEMIEGADANGLRTIIDQLKNKLQSAAIILGSVLDGKVLLVAGVTKDLTNQIKAGELVNFVAQQVGGKGGGRPDMAQAGGTEPKALPAALKSVHDWVAQQVK